VEDEVVEKAKRVVGCLNIDYDPRDFENPSLQRHYAVLQSLALNEDEVEPTEDQLLPDLEGMRQVGIYAADDGDEASSMTL
jgi:ATP-dependent DNA helicase 2 subunit 1